MLTDHGKAWVVGGVAFCMFLLGVIGDAKTLGSWEKLNGFEFAVDTAYHFVNTVLGVLTGKYISDSRKE